MKTKYSSIYDLTLGILILKNVAFSMFAQVAMITFPLHMHNKELLQLLSNLFEPKKSIKLPAYLLPIITNETIAVFRTL